MIEKKQTDMIKAETSKQSKQRKSKEELKQSTKCYKIYCGVEYSRARCLNRSKRSDYLFGVLRSLFVFFKTAG